MSFSLPLDSFVCQTRHCPDFHQPGRQNIHLRKLYGPERPRLLRCRTCGTEFSETKGTPYWGSNLPPEQVDRVIDHVTHGTCFSATAILTDCHRTTVARIVCRAGVHLEQFHDQHARDLKVTSMQADERHGFVGEKAEHAWDFTVVDPKSKFVIEGQVGARTAALTKALLVNARERLANLQHTVPDVVPGTLWDSTSPSQTGKAGSLFQVGLPHSTWSGARPNHQGVQRKPGGVREDRDCRWNT